MKSFLKNPTLFSLLGLLFMVVGLPVGIYSLTLDGGGSLGGVTILFAVFWVSVIFVIDRLIAKKVSAKKLNVSEIFILIIGAAIFSFSRREIIMDLSDSQTNYFILVENDGASINSQLKYSFPFNQKIVVSGNIAIIESIQEIFQRLELKSPEHWRSQRMQPWRYNNQKIRFYSNGKIDFQEKEIDSIINLELNSG